MNIDSTKIRHLTPEQEAKIPAYLDKYMKIGLSTDLCDREAAEAALRQLYKAMNYGELKGVHWFDGPLLGAAAAAKCAKLDPREAHLPDAFERAMLLDVSKDEMADQIGKASFGSFESYWVSFYDFIQNELDVQKHPLVDICIALVQHCGIFWTFEGHAIVTEKPTSILTANHKLASPGNQPALEYRDGTTLYVSESGKMYPSLVEMLFNKKSGDK